MNTKDLGLAAFIKMHDVALIEVSGRYFYFDTSLTENQWRVQYQNSCCHQHDTTLCELRKFVSKQK